MKQLTDLHVWHDPTARSGPSNMAIDELLLRQTLDTPILRFYSWSHDAVSFGYFEKLRVAQRLFPSNSHSQIEYTRRWTGGGIVDHRTDLTYTLIIPRSHPMASLRGAESYCQIHHIVAAALNAQKVDCEVIGEDSGSGANACFENPVAYDIVTPTGAKLAGAGQKRSRYGLLHQGSVVGILHKKQWQDDFQHLLSEHSNSWQPDAQLLTEAQQLTQQKYATSAWLEKR